MKLWYENKLANEKEIDNMEILEQYQNSGFKDKEEYKEMYRDMKLRMFLTTKEGLNSSFEEEEFQELLDLMIEKGIR